jgi:type VI secretion system protein ImpI/type VI secretion system protein
MSTLTLTVLRCPDAAALQQRQAQGGQIVIGRGSDCDWRLEADKEISKKHCALEFYAGGWQVRDLSTNGTFVNRPDAPVGRERGRPLVDGDRLLLGAYEIEVRITEDAAAADNPMAVDWSADAPLTPVAGARKIPAGWSVGAAAVPGLDGPPAATVPSLPPMRDAAGSTAEAFVPHANPQPQIPPSQKPIPSDWYQREIAGAPVTRPIVRALPPAPSPLTSAAESTQPLLEVAIARQGPAASARPLASEPATPASQPPSSAAGFAGFAAGFQIPADMMARAAADPEAALLSAGSLLRAAVSGIRALLIARGDVKREFRIEQTTLRAADNNPLKFAATDEDALARLLDPRTDASRAMREAVEDLTVHQVATLAATQAAARALLERLAPAQIEAQDNGGGLIPGLREKRLWEAYRRHHAQLLEQFEDDFDSAFGKAFARAYEQAADRPKG